MVRRLSVVFAVVVFGAVVSAAPLVGQASVEECVYSWEAFEGGLDDPEGPDVELPAGGRYRLRVLTIDDRDVNYTLRILGSDGSAIRTYHNLHTTRPHNQMTVEVDLGGPWTYSGASTPITLEVSGFDSGTPLPTGFVLEPSLIVELPLGECDRLSREVIGDRNGDVSSNGVGGDPVTTGTGNFVYRPGLGGGSWLLPTYNSLDAWVGRDPATQRSGLFGHGWSSLLDATSRRMSDQATAGLLMRLPSGRTRELPPAATNAWVPPPELGLVSVTRNPTGGAYRWEYNTGAVWSFDAQGRLVSIEDGFAARVEVTRSANGVPTRVATRREGVVGDAWTVVDSGSDGLIDAVVGPFDADVASAPAGTPQVTFGYDSDGRLSSVSAPHMVGDPPLGGEAYGYVRNSLIGTVTRDRGPGLSPVTVVENEFGAADRVVEQVTATGEVDTFGYEFTPTGVVTTVAHSNGTDVETLVFRHDSVGRVAAIDDPYLNSTAATWLGDEPTSHRRRGGGESTMDYDTDRRPVALGFAHPTVAGAQAGSVTRSYCAAGDPRPREVVDLAGVVTRYWWSNGPDPTACDAGRSVPVKVTTAHGTASAGDTLIESLGGVVTRVTEAPSGDQVITDYHWDAGRRLMLARIEYPDGPSQAGLVTYFGYDPAGRQLVERDPGGVETWWVRDAAGRVTDQVGPVAVARQCGPVSCVFAASPPTGPTQTWDYDLAGTVVAYSDESGAVTTVEETYPSGGGRVVSVTEPEHGDDPDDLGSRVATVTTSTYDRFDRLVGVTSGDPGSPATLSSTIYRYDPLGRVATRSSSVGGGVADLVESYSYDADGNQTAVVHGANVSDTDRAVVTRSYDLRGRLVDERGPTGDVTAPAGVSGSSPAAVRSHTQWVYDDADRLMATVVGDGPEQQTTFHRYDEAGRLRYVIIDRDGDQVVAASPTGGPTDADDGVTEYRYTPAGRLDAIVEAPVDAESYDWSTGDQALKRATTFDYDGAGRVVTVTDAEEGVTLQSWNARGLLEEVTRPGGAKVSYGYDAAGRVVRTTSPSPTGSGTVDALTTYDARGLLTTVTEQHPSGTPTPPTTGYVHYPDGSLFGSVNPNGGWESLVTYYYDARGNRTARMSTTKASSSSPTHPVIDTWAYDLADRVVSERPAGSPGPTLTTYDAVTGRMSTRTLPSGRTETTQWWNSGRIRSVTTTKPADANGPGDQHRECWWFNSAGQPTFGLDDHLVGDPCTTGAVSSKEWTPAGTLASVTAPPGPHTNGAPDSIDYRWDLGGRRRQVVLPDGSTQVSSHDRLGRLMAIDEQIPGGVEPVVAYSYDDNGYRTSENVSGGAVQRSWTYSPNAAPQPVSYTEQTPAGTRSTALTWRPDGRRGSETSGSSTRVYGYDKAGQLTSRTDTSGPDHTYTYGPRGLRLTAAVDASTTSYTYNDAAQPIAVASPPWISATLTYDADGNRTRVTYAGFATTETTYDARGLPVEVETDSIFGDAQTTLSHDIDGRLVSRAHTPAGSSTKTKSFVRDPTQPEALPVVTRAGPNDLQRVDQGHEPVRIDTATGVVDLNVTHDRSVLAAPALPGAPTDYAPFGAPNPPLEDTVGYRSEIHLDNLIHLRHRNYDPNAAAFTTRDPLDGIPGTPTETNPYHYANNDPINHTDPLGLSPNDANINQASTSRSVWGGVGVTVAAACTTGAVIAMADSPAPGPADAVGATICTRAILAWALGSATYACYSTDCLEAPPDARQPDPNTPTQPSTEPDDTPTTTLPPIRLPNPCQAPQTPGCEGPALYHYTDAAGMAGILACQCINASSASTNARHGDGTYFTDLAPEGVTGTTAGQLSRALYGLPWNASRVTHFVAVDSLMVVPLPVWVAPLNSSTYPGSILLSPSTMPVSVAGAVRRSGAVPF